MHEFWRELEYEMGLNVPPSPRRAVEEVVDKDNDEEMEGTEPSGVLESEIRMDGALRGEKEIPIPTVVIGEEQRFGPYENIVFEQGQDGRIRATSLVQLKDAQ